MMGGASYQVIQGMYPRVRIRPAPTWNTEAPNGETHVGVSDALDPKTIKMGVID